MFLKFVLARKRIQSFYFKTISTEISTTEQWFEMCLEGLNHKALQTSLHLSTGGAALFNCCSDSIRSCDSLPPTISSQRSRGPPHRTRERKNSLRTDKTNIAEEIWESAGKGFETENWPQVPQKLSLQIKKTMKAAETVSKQFLPDSYRETDVTEEQQPRKWAKVCSSVWKVAIDCFDTEG